MDPEKNAKFHAPSTPADTSSMARNLRADTLWCSLPQPFLQKSEKFPFHLTVEERALFILALFAGGLRELLTSSGVQKKRRTDRDIFFFSPLWVFFVEWKGNLETLCNVASKVLKGLWERFFFSLFFFCQSRVRASVRWKRGSPCCIHTEWSPTSFHLWVSSSVYLVLSLISHPRKLSSRSVSVWFSLPTFSEKTLVNGDQRQVYFTPPRVKPLKVASTLCQIQLKHC